MKKIINYIAILFIFITLTGCNKKIEEPKKDTLNEEINELEEDTYKDVIYNIVNEKEEEKFVLYFFHGNGCPHCEDELEFLSELEGKYSKYLTIKKYETWYNETNNQYMRNAKSHFNISRLGVPFTVIGENYFEGYSDSIGKKIESAILKYIKSEYPDVIDENNELIIDKNVETIPFLGNINVKTASITTIAIILGFIDGFNPCAMWVLIFLITMLFNMKDKKRMWILGYAFLITSALFYFLAIFFLDIFLSALTTKIIRYLIGTIALIGGLFNLKKYFKTSDGCEVTTNNQRKKIIQHIQKFTSEKKFIIALLGVIVLAISVNIIEIMCTTGFPTLFLSILEINNIVGMEKLIYLIIYIILYMIDDLVVFIISMITLETTGISTKYNKLSLLIGGILMIIMGILLIFKYNWLMFNFK